MISVIIVTKDRRADLKSCIESILKQSVPVNELIIVDSSLTENGIERSAKDILSGSPVSLKYAHSSPGIPHQRNIGISLLDPKTDFVCFFDDDAVLADDAIGSAMRKFAEYKDIVAIQGVETNRKPENSLGKMIRKIFCIQYEDNDSRILLSGENTFVIKPQSDIPITSFMVGFCLKKSVVDEFKFDEWFSGYAYLEDFDFSYRVCSKYKAIQSPSVRYLHNKSPAARSSSFAVSKMFITNKSYIFRKYFSKSIIRRVFFLWSLLGHIILNLGKSAAKRDPGYFLGTIAGFIGKVDRWSIGIYTGDSPYNFKPAENARNPVLMARNITDRKAVFVADPFMVKEGDTWHMFFEVVNAGTYKADIGLAESRDGLRWKYRQIVLSEPFHLSYPYVFKLEDDYFMLPETIKAGGIRLYRAAEFPLRWSFVKELIHGNYTDSSIFRHEGRWWIFTTGERQGDFKNDLLRLFYAQDLLGEWTEHPKSPVIRDNMHIARPGGRVLSINGRVVRYAQDDDPVYGTGVRAFDITKLTPTEYEEKVCSVDPVLKPNGIGWSRSGMHTIDPHFIGEGRWLACVDGNSRYPGLKRSPRR